MLHPVVLSGGSGTRLWPLSRKNQPKQFLALVGERSLYQETVLRAAALPDAQAPITVCSDDHRFMVGEQLQAISVDSGGILLEPAPQDRGPCETRADAVERGNRRIRRRRRQAGGEREAGGEQDTGHERPHASIPSRCRSTGGDA